MSYLFVKEPKGWFLKIQTVDELLQYVTQNQLFNKDKEQFKKLQSYDNNDHTLVTHSEFGWFITNGIKNGLSCDEAYDLLANCQLQSMLKVLNETGAIYVNRNGGFHGNYIAYDNFVHRKTLDFPRFYSKDIRIKRFEDGTHWYAYVGDMQVHDGDILKWNSYDEAYNQAKKYVYGGENE
mgnify:CR=1 FL=1